MAKRSSDPTPSVATEQQQLAAREEVLAGEVRAPAAKPETGDARSAAPSPLPDPAPSPPHDSPPATAVAMTTIERFRVEGSVYYVPHLGFGAIFVPSGTIVTRESHDVQKLIEQGAKLRPILD